MLTRRSALIGVAAAAACGTLPSPATAGNDLLDHAIARMGGVDAINRSRVLAWTGHARIHADRRNIDIGVESVVEPFVYARSDTWLLSQGRGSMRSLEIDGHSGATISNGQSSPMSAAMYLNEKAQFATYGLMRLVSLRDAGASFTTMPIPGSGIPITWRYGLVVDHPAAPSATLYFDNTAALVGIVNNVPSPNGGGMSIDQLFTFGELRESQTGMYWPTSISITQDHLPFFDLTIETFSPRQAR